MSEEFSMDIDEKSIEELKKAINYDEIEKRYQRFMNGTETEYDLINGMYHYKIQNDKGLDLDVVEFKYYQKLINLYNKEKEKNKELQIKVRYYEDIMIKQNVEKKFETLYKGLYKIVKTEYVSKDKIKNKIEEYIETLKTAINIQTIQECKYGIKVLQKILEE